MSDSDKTKAQLIAELHALRRQIDDSRAGIPCSSQDHAETGRTSEDLYRTLFQSLEDPVLVADSETGTILECNQAATRYFGKSREELVGRHQSNIHPPEATGPDGRTSHFKMHVADPDISPDTVVIAAGGERRIVYVRTAPVEVHGRKALVGIFRDVTEQRQAEEALCQSEAQYRNLFESMNEGLCVLELLHDAEGRPMDYLIHDVNPAYEHILGVERDAVLGRRVTEALGLATPPNLDVYTTLLETGQPVVFDTFIPELDKHFMVSAFPLAERRFVTMFQDITDSYLSSRALEKSEGRFRDLFHNAPVPLAYVNNEGRIVDINARFIALFGYTLEDIPTLERWWPQAFPDPEYREYVQKSWNGALTALVEHGGEMPSQEYRVVCKTGEQRVVLVSGHPVGEGFMAGFMDITDRRKAEDALRKRLEIEQVLAGVSGELVGMRFEDIPEALPPLLGIVAESIGTDMAQVCLLGSDVPACLSSESTKWNRGLCEGAELQAHAWLMSRLKDLESIILRDIADLPPEAAQEREALAEKGVKSLLAVPLVKGEAPIGCLAFMATGRHRDWPSGDVSLIETFARILANVIDAALLERTLRYNERRYFELIDNLSEGLFVVDENLRISFTNKSLAAMLGYEPGEILGQDLRSYMTAEALGELDRELQNRREGKTGNYSSEYVHKDGHRVFVNVSASPMRDEQGNVVGSMALISDLSKERLLRLQLMQAQRLEAIGQLAAGIAHEINTPTQYVDNNTQFLRGAFDDLLAVLHEYAALLGEARGVQTLSAAVKRVEDALEEHQTDDLLDDIPGAFDDAIDGLQRIAVIVDSVKRFAHPGQEGMQMADLNEAIQGTITVARNEWKYVAEVTTDLAPDLPPVPCVLSDINQVVLNLIVNAAHAIAACPDRAPDAKGLITVRTRTEEGHAVIEVQDTGKGIPADIRERIFDPFFTTKEVGKGTGQGLAISRTVVVDKHHGSITFETEDGTGTTFSVRLPLTQEGETS